MSLRKGLVRFVIVTAPFEFCWLATQTRAHSQNENANATAHLYRTVSIKPSKSDVHANTLLTLGPVAATNEFLGALIEVAYEVQDDQIVGAPRPKR